MKKKKIPIQRQTQNLLALSESNNTAKLQDRKNQKEIITINIDSIYYINGK